MKSHMYNNLCLHIRIKNLQNRCKIMVQKEDPQKKAVLPESVPNDDLDLLYLASLSAPLMISPLYGMGIPESGAEASTENSPRATGPALCPSFARVRRK